MRRDFATLILAAGASRRLGRPKALVRIGGVTLAVRATHVAQVLRPLWIGVVVGAQASRIASALRAEPVHLVRSRHWRDGMSASLRAGFAAVPRRARHVLVLAVDQWAVGAADLRRLLSAVRRGPVAAAYSGTIGIPAVIPLAWRARVAGLRGDRGARSLLRTAHAPAVPLDAAALDLDTPADLRRLRREARRVV